MTSILLLWLDNKTECFHCSSNCTTGGGCNGPLSIRDDNEGCLQCDSVLLNETGQQVSQLVVKLKRNIVGAIVNIAIIWFLFLLLRYSVSMVPVLLDFILIIQTVCPTYH